ncbi:adenosylmethionine--8-amino-7-oxononanoate transaminase [soil metagenome]
MAGAEEFDRAFCWHPFTQMAEWCAADSERVVLVRGKGATLFDSRDNAYLDGNSSIWTNVHGHAHPKLVKAIADQAGRLPHASFLGATNEPAARLAARLVGLCAGGGGTGLKKVFYTDDGSTAVECALRMELEYRQLVGEAHRQILVSFDQAYHGDTLGAASLGGIPRFHDRLAAAGFEVHRVAGMEALSQLAEAVRDRVAAVVIEPLVQGAAGMRLWPKGMLRELRGWCDQFGVHLILDEVMTGFGRTGKMFAFEHEGIRPDFLALAKGLTGGTLPLAATLTTQQVFDAFLGDVADGKAFLYGHSYAGNPLGCAAALANLDLFEEEQTLERLQPKIAHLTALLDSLSSDVSHVGEIRQCGFIAGIDLVRDRSTGEQLDWRDQSGARVCLAARKHGLLTRPVLDTIVLMPPLCITRDELTTAVRAIRLAIRDVLDPAP